MQKTRGGTLVFVTGILYIIFGAITLVMLAFAIAALGMVGGGALTAPLIISLIFPTVVVVFEFGAGIYAVRNAHKLPKAGKLFENAIGLLIIMIISIASEAYAGSLTVLSFVSLVLPILMLVGAGMNKKEAQESGVQIEKSGKKNSQS